MKARFLVLFAALVLVGTLPAQAIQRAPAVADPASAPIVSSAPASPTDETKVPHYFGPYPNWANSPMTLPDATVTIDAAAVAPVSVGNPLVDRAFATDFATGPGTLGPVLVVLPNAVLPHGTLDSFQVWNQATTGGSPTPSEGGVFYALVLHPTGVPNEYTVAYVSSQLTMPAGTDPAGNIASFHAGIAVVAGDVIGFYGEGIPVDDAGTGSDILSYPATANADLVTPQAPAQGDTLSIGSAAGYPLFSTTRTYSFGAVVTPPGTGAGSGATAEATVGANGAVTGLTITNPGAGYVVPPTVTISGSGSGATADAVIQASGAVTSVTVDQAGAGYTQPSVTFSGGGATTDATGHVLGGVDAVTLADPGSGYVFPTIDFDLPDDPNGIQAQGHAVCVEENCAPASDGATVTITGIAVDNPGSGYAKAPGIFVRDGTQFDPVAHDPTVNPLTLATATATLSVQEVVLDTFGAGYTSSPTVAFADTGTGTGASATAATDFGSVVALNLTNPGSGYITGGGMRKFVDELPGLTPDGVNNLGQYIPIAVPDTTTFPDDPNVPGDQGADYYVIAVVQHREQMHSDLPPTLLREYVQLSTAAVPGNQVALQTALKAGGTTPTLMPDGSQAYGVDDPHFLGPLIVATRDRAVRITFYNLLPTGSEGDLFLPVDSTIMGSGMGPAPNMAMPMDEGTVTDEIRNPICTDDPQDAMCFKQNRATLHLHGGVTPWISDGTPHQWITPAGENTMWPKGVAVQEVPDMVGAEAASKGIPDCSAGTSG